jgi:hypothetical protein
MRADLLEATKWLIDKSLEDGTSFEQFTRSFNRRIGRAGYQPSGQKIKLIFDTNINKSYWQGREKVMRSPEMLAKRPLFLWRHRDSLDERKSHKALHNKAIPADHPFWKEVSFPLGFNCFTPDTLVETEDGWRKISSVRVGDRVVGGSGHLNPATAIHRNRYVGKMIRTVGEEGLPVESTPNHRFLTINGWVRAENLRAGDVLVKVPKGAALDNNVCNIDKPNALGRDLDVSPPFSGQGIPTEALYPKLEDGDINVNPPLADVVVKDDLKTETFKVSNHQSLALGWLDGCIDMRLRVFFQPLVESFFGFSSYFWSQKGTRSLQLLSGSGDGFAGVLRLAKPGMDVGIPRFNLSYVPPSLLFSSFITDPLECNRFSALPDVNIIHDKKLSHGSGVYTPFTCKNFEGDLVSDIIPLKDLNYGEVFNPLNIENNLLEFPRHGLLGLLDIRKADLFYNRVKSLWVCRPIFAETENPLVQTVDSGVEGFEDGAPLNSFDSLDSFKDWAKSHCILNTVANVSPYYYSGFVVNLSVLNDESYNLQSATVHNCKCTAFPVTEDYCKRNDIEILDNPPDPDTLIDNPGFKRGNDNKTRAQILEQGLKRLSPDLRTQVQKQIKVK